MNSIVPSGQTPEQRSAVGRLIGFCLDNRLFVVLCTMAVIFAGVVFAPFDWKLRGIERRPIAVDAIPDIGENQQIVFTDWMGRSPQDVEDQITYPLTVQLLGVPGVKTIRSYSMFGFSSIYVIFKEKVDFYWSRSRVLEKLNSLPPGALPEGVRPTLGPDATALGQVFWYSLEGRDPAGRPTGGWDPEELRAVQDWYARYWLLAADGVAEVASIGGYVKEYQVDVDPDALRAYGVTIDDVYNAVKGANIDVGAQGIELNRVEYFIRGIGFVKRIQDLENSVVKTGDGHVPVLVKNVARVVLGPAARRGALDRGGADVVGGVVVARYGANPLEVINNVKQKIAETRDSLPKKTLADGTVSQLAVVPFYDRTGLIYETLGTLNESIAQEILVTILVVLVMVAHLRSGLVISSMLPLTVLLCFIGMKVFGVQANIVALSGIVIAIGTIVDMGIVVCENVLRNLDQAPPGEPRRETVHRAASEVGSAVLTAVLTTVVSFLPVFTMIGAEGKLFKPLAYTKTTALVASIVIALTLLPVMALTFFRKDKKAPERRPQPKHPALHSLLRHWPIVLTILAVDILLAVYWEPLGPERGFLRNILFATLLLGGLLGLFALFQHFYVRILRWCLAHKLLFLSLPLLIGLAGFGAWRQLGKEFMPPLDEGSFLWMPTTMTHASIGESLDILRKQDAAIATIPEVESAVGKLGRAESPLDPAPVSMFETIVNYKSEYKTDKDGRRLNFKYENGDYVRDANGELVPDPHGRPFRQWRDEIRSPDDIWNEIVMAAQLPGATSAPKLQPIAARIVMLQSGMRAPMGVKVKGPDLETIEKVGIEIEHLLKQVPSVEPAAVVADRIVGKPYLEIVPDRGALARYGVTIRMFQDVVETAIGGQQVTTTVEGRERFPVRVRYARELRGDVESLKKILVPGEGGQQIPLSEVADIRYVRGPQEIKSEDTFLVGYILFDKKPGFAEVNVVEDCQKYLQSKIASGELVLPKGVSYTFAGSYENEQRAARTLAVILPVALFAIFMIIYFQFKSVPTTLLVFSGIFVAWSGGFLLLWLYGQPWFLNVSLFGVEMRSLFQVHTINMSVAVWVGFLALFGIATDDGVIMSTYIAQIMRDHRPTSVQEVREAVVLAGSRRIRPCLMTVATTILALLPVLTSTGRGSDIMVPMAIPSFGGMTAAVITVFVVPVLYSWIAEIRLGKTRR